MQAMLLQIYFGAWSGNLWAFESSIAAAARLTMVGYMIQLVNADLCL